MGIFGRVIVSSEVVLGGVGQRGPAEGLGESACSICFEQLVEGCPDRDSLVQYACCNSRVHSGCLADLAFRGAVSCLFLFLSSALSPSATGVKPPPLARAQAVPRAAQGSSEAEDRGPRGLHGRATAHRTPLQSADPDGSVACESPEGAATRYPDEPVRARRRHLRRAYFRFGAC